MIADRDGSVCRVCIRRTSYPPMTWPQALSASCDLLRIRRRRPFRSQGASSVRSPRQRTDLTSQADLNHLSTIFQTATTPLQPHFRLRLCNPSLPSPLSRAGDACLILEQRAEGPPRAGRREGHPLHASALVNHHAHSRTEERLWLATLNFLRAGFPLNGL